MTSECCRPRGVATDSTLYALLAVPPGVTGEFRVLLTLSSGEIMDSGVVVDVDPRPGIVAVDHIPAVVNPKTEKTLDLTSGGTLMRPLHTSGPRVGLVLGGGGALGLAHIGVIEWLEDHRIPVDMVSGNSMGALVGGLYASGVPIKQVERLATDADQMQNAFTSQTDYETLSARRREDRREMPASLTIGLTFAFPSAVVLDHGIYQILDQYLQPYPTDFNFDNFPRPFRTLASDLSSSATTEHLDTNRYVFCSGDIRQAIRSSVSVPGLLAPVTVQDPPDFAHNNCDGEAAVPAARFDPTKEKAGTPFHQHQLVDGELVDNFPVDLMKTMGPKVIIGVSLPESNYDQGSGLISNFTQGLSIADWQNEVRSIADLNDFGGQHYLIVPQTQGFSSADYSPANVVKIIAAGYAAAEGFSRDHPEIIDLALSEDEWQQYEANVARSVPGEPKVGPSHIPARVEVVDGHGSSIGPKPCGHCLSGQGTAPDILSLTQHRVALDQAAKSDMTAAIDKLKTPITLGSNTDVRNTTAAPKGDDGNPHISPTAAVVQEGQQGKTIESALKKVEGTGNYRADYSPLPATDAENAAMLVTLRTYTEGPPFLMFGFEGSGETRGVTRGTAEIRAINQWKSYLELRGSFKFGFLTEGQADADFRLRPWGLHFIPATNVLRQPVYLYANQVRIGEAFEQRGGGGGNLTLDMPGSPWEVRAGYEVLRERWSQRYGLGAGPNVLETPQDGHLQVSRDTRDDAFLPKSGTYFNVLGGYRYGTLSGSDTPFARGEMNWTYTPISTKQPKCWPTECAADNCDRQSLLNRLSSGWRLHLAGEGGTQAQRIAVDWNVLWAAPRIKLLEEHGRTALELAKGENQRDRVLSTDELTAYLENCPQPWQDAATIIADEGMRPGEVFVLRWEHIFLGEEGEGLIRVVDGKSKAARRILPMTPRVYELLKARNNAQDNPAEGWIFPSQSKHGHLEVQRASGNTQRPSRTPRLRRSSPTYSGTRRSPGLGRPQGAMCSRWRRSPGIRASPSLRSTSTRKRRRLARCSPD
jgi:NTE family protein